MIRKHKVRVWAFRVVCYARDEYQAKCIRVRNRWQLAFRCLQQPALKRARNDARLQEELKVLNEAGKERATESLAQRPATADAGASDGPVASDAPSQADTKSALREDVEKLKKKLEELGEVESLAVLEHLAAAGAVAMD